MKYIVLILSFVFSFSLKAEECTSFIDVISGAMENNGMVHPIDRDHARVLYHIGIIPLELYNNTNIKFYVEDRNEPLVRLFTMKNECAGIQWMISRDFLILMGIQKNTI